MGARSAHRREIYPMSWRRWDLRVRCWIARWNPRRWPLGISDITGETQYTADLRCGCHWHPTYGPVVMAGCERYD